MMRTFQRYFYKGGRTMKNKMRYLMAGSLLLMPSLVLAESDPVRIINNLSDFLFSLIRAVGMILLGFGVVQVGLSLKSHDPSQRANGFMTLAGGLVITFAKEILALITG